MDNPLENNISTGSDAQVPAAEIVENTSSEMPIVSNPESKKSFFTIRKIVSFFAGLVLIGAVVGTVLYSQSGERLQGNLVLTHQTTSPIISSSTSTTTDLKSNNTLTAVGTATTETKDTSSSGLTPAGELSPSGTSSVSTSSSTSSTTGTGDAVYTSSACDASKGLITITEIPSLTTHDSTNTTSCICKDDLGWDSTQDKCIAMSCYVTEDRFQKIIADSKTSASFAEISYESWRKDHRCDAEITLLDQPELTTSTTTPQLGDNPSTEIYNPNNEIIQKAPCPDGMTLEGDYCVCDGREVEIKNECTEFKLDCDAIYAEGSLEKFLEKWRIIEKADSTSSDTEQYIRTRLDMMQQDGWYDKYCSEDNIIDIPSLDLNYTTEINKTGDTCDDIEEAFIEAWKDKASSPEARQATSNDLLASDCMICETLSSVLNTALDGQDLGRVEEIIELMQGSSVIKDKGCDYCDDINAYITQKESFIGTAPNQTTLTFIKDLKGLTSECEEITDDTPDSSTVPNDPDEKITYTCEQIVDMIDKSKENRSINATYWWNQYELYKCGDDVPTDTSHTEDIPDTSTIPRSCTLTIVKPVDAQDGHVELDTGYSAEPIAVNVVSNGYDIESYKYHSIGGTIKFNGQATEYFTGSNSVMMDHILNGDDEVVVWAIDKESGKGVCNDSFKITMNPEDDKYVPEDDKDVPEDNDKDPCIEITDKLAQIDAGESDESRPYWWDQYNENKCTDYTPPPVDNDDDTDDGCPVCPTCPKYPTCEEIQCPVCDSTTTGTSTTTNNTSDSDKYISTTVPSSGTSSTTSVGNLHGASNTTSIPPAPGELNPGTTTSIPLHSGAPVPYENPQTGPGLLLLVGAGLGGAYLRRKKK